ncbi:MAG TPA: hypothetical protein VNX28_16760 [Gemmataceae bacterium]|jgi:hypothetical protein|nr:hypothetical protein [Gemmataceae bacterium]
MKRILSLAVLAVAFVLPACSSSSEPEQPPAIAAEPPMVIPPPPPPFVDVLPEFKKGSRAFIDMARKLDGIATSTPTPPYQTYWKECEPLEEIYGKVISNEPKSGPGAHTFERINKIRDSLFQTRLLLKNKDGLKGAQLSQLLESEADKRKPFFDEAEFYWKQTPEFTKQDD